MLELNEFLIAKTGLFGLFFTYFLMSNLICKTIGFVVNYLATKYLIYSLQKRIQDGTIKVVPLTDFDTPDKDTQWN